MAYDDAGAAAWRARLALDGAATGSLSGAELRGAIGTTADTVAAIVTFHDPSERAETYARYQLEVNGDLQPGG